MLLTYMIISSLSLPIAGAATRCASFPVCFHAAYERASTSYSTYYHQCKHTAFSKKREGVWFSSSTFIYPPYASSTPRLLPPSSLCPATNTSTLRMSQK